jgi:Carbohydrate binding domain/PEP-CTERM motif
MRKASPRELLLLLVVAVVALGLGFPRWTSANLITNGGFETGDFTGWTLSGNVSGSTLVSPTAAHTGNFGALLGAIGSLNFLSQTLTTVPGTTYEITFWQLFDGGLPNEFSVSWDGTVLSDLVNHAATPYTLYTFHVVAPSSSTVLQFGSRDDPGFLRLDDVAVNSVAEPGTLLLLASSLAGLGWFTSRRQRRR